MRITRAARRDPAGPEPGDTRLAAAPGTGSRSDDKRLAATAPGPSPGQPAAPGPSPRQPGRAWLRGSRGLLALFAGSLILALAGVGLVVAGAQQSGSPASANRALTDPAATRQVVSMISADLTKIFSYSYTGLTATQRAARQVLAGSAAAQYDMLFPQLRDAGSQKLAVVSRVVDAGVTQLSADIAQLLVFLDQTATRGSAQVGSTPYHAQLAVTAQFRAGQWLITDIEAR